MGKGDRDVNRPTGKPAARRYVGTRETIWYILYDVSASFNIDSSDATFIADNVHISKGSSGIVKILIGFWDVINDVLLSSVIEKTRTRWGKFKPFLVLYAGPGIMLSCAYWLMPVLFSVFGIEGSGKVLFYFILLVFRNFADSLRNIARDGMLATITPDFSDRSRLINSANLLSGFLEKLPEQLFALVRSLAVKSMVHTPMQKLYMGFGTTTVIIGGLMALGFSLVAKERVIQSSQRPKLLHSIKLILRCRPVLLITLSELLGSLTSVSIDSDTYYLNVLLEPLITQVTGIPGAFMTPLSYSYAPALQRRFPTRTLWMFSSHFGNVLMLGVYFIARRNKRYKNKLLMIVLLTIRETIWMSIQALRQNIPKELRNEAMDFFEWQNGFRAEAMIGTVVQLAAKLCRTFTGSLSDFILERSGYDVHAGPGGQTEKVEKTIFMLFAFLPNAMSLIGMIPKFFYNITPEQKDRMAAELQARRAVVAQADAG